MRILLVTEFFPADEKLRFTGGVEARTFYIGRYLSSSDQVSVICRKTKGLESFKKIDNISIYPCGLKTLSVEANFFSVFERLVFIFSAFFKGLSLEFDLVEGSNFISYLSAYLLGLVKRKPKIVWYPDVLGKNWFRFFGLTGGFGWLIEKLSLYLKWDKVIALSESTKKKLIKKGIDKNNIKTIYGGVDFKKLSKFKAKKKKEKNIIFIGRLVKYKKVGDLILAFKKLSKKYPQLTLTIVGQGPEKKGLKLLTKGKELVKKVKFLENLDRDKLIKILKQSYLFCLPSIIEGFGLVTIEAAACGIPYVVSDIKVNKEITKNGLGGLLFKAGDINDLEKKIEYLLKNMGAYQKKEKQGTELAKGYDWQKIAAQTRKVYNKSIDE